MQPSETHSNATQTLLIPEILSEIFMHCVPDGSLSAGHSSALSMAPLNLSRVCNRWRAVSLSTADLWTHICVEGVLTRLPNKALDRVNVWIARSRSRPLSITLRIRHPSNSRFDIPEQHDPVFEGILSVVLSQSSLWRNAHFFVPPQFKNILFAQLHTGDLSSLEEFTAEFSPQPHPYLHQLTNGSVDDTFPLSSAPRLRYLRVSHPMTIDIKRRSHNVEHLDFPSDYPAMSYGDLIKCIMQCPRLMYLSYSVDASAGTFLPPSLPPFLTLSKLTGLVIAMSPETNICDLFDRLFLPALKSLELSMEESTTLDWPHLLPMLERCRPPLESLCLVTMPITESVLLSCLALTPNLRVLWFHHMPFTDRLLAALTVDDTGADFSTVLCPSLENLTIFGVYPDMTPGAMKLFLLSRRQGPLPPGKFLTRISAPRALLGDIQTDPVIEKCVNDGLEYVVRSD